jgi:membrane protein implicated in regulation of membrane protease activity
MSKQFAIEWVLIISFPTAYLLIGTLLTGEAIPFVVVLLLVLVTWFLVYRSRHRSLENRELLTRMYADLKGARERIAEGLQIGQKETQRRSARRDERLARMKRERRARPTKDSTMRQVHGYD